MKDLLTIVPTRGRPTSVPRLAQAWRDTGAHVHADLLLALDLDDPELHHYLAAVDAEGAAWLTAEVYGPWQPMVTKLNTAANAHATTYPNLGFAGDDHVPRTPGWAQLYTAELARLGVGIVYGDDGIWNGRLSTEWAMSSAIVLRLGRMVPARVQHLYCDNAVMELGLAAGCVTYLGNVFIEHMHPTAGKAPTDPGYAAVNSAERYRDDHANIVRWRRFVKPRQVAAVRVLRATRRAAR